MINLTKAILHILDGNSGAAVYSAAQMDLSQDAVYGYVCRHLEKAAGDVALHSGEFIGVGNEFRVKLKQYAGELLAFEPLPRSGSHSRHGRSSQARTKSTPRIC